MMYKLLVGMFGLLVVIAMIPVAVIAFNAPISPPAMASMGAALRRINPDLPTPRQFQARDGASLQYYAYPAGPDQVAVLVHGSAGPGTTMHALAQALRAAGPAKSSETRTLVGFSAGAGFTIRFAGGPHGPLFDRYVFLSPILPGSPAWRPNAGGWTSIALPRILTISWLDGLGIHWFDGFSVINYAVPPELARSMTASYSYRLSMNFGAARQYETYLKNIHRPAAVLVGDEDEQVVADQFAPLLQRLDVNIPVTRLPDMKHADMISAPAALQAVVRAVSRQK
jgi:pimeloyl-ACP methyl ester carboxylesterase